MRKYLLLLALLATGDAFAWSLDARVASKPICDRTDAAPAASLIAARQDVPVARPDAPVARQESPSVGTAVVANPVVGTAASVAATPAAKTGGAGFGRARNTPRWQSFLPGMFK